MAEIGHGLAEWVLGEAKRNGATAADVLLVSAQSLSAAVRLGEIDKLTSASERRLGLRVFVGNASATSSTAELERGALEPFIAQTVGLARLTAPDPWSGLPEPALHPRTLPELELVDPTTKVVAGERAIEIARTAEQAALKFDPRIKNSEGAEFDSGFYSVLLANGQGFAGEYSVTHFSLSARPVAQDDGSMQQGFWYTAGCRLAGLEQAESVGATAARRALRRLGARKIKTTRAPVIFDAEMAASLLRTLAGAVCGPSLYRRTSFLVDRLGDQIAAPNVTVVDDGTMRAGLASRPFDGEGLATSCKDVVQRGVLSTYLLDCYSARKLKLAPTGNASRSVGEAPTASPANLYLKPGPYSPEEIIRTVKQGLYLTDMIGFGVNLVTGDYSRGASGIWIENGELAYPVQEVTVAGNLKEMLMAIEMVGNDLQWRSSTAAPTLKIAEMTIAGQ